MKAKTPKPEKFNFEKMKAAATSKDSSIRKRMFIDYFERFEEFPAYLFENQEHIDDRLHETIEDLRKDPMTTQAMQKGIDALVERLPSRVVQG